jgi:hypothetical protein
MLKKIDIFNSIYWTYIYTSTFVELYIFSIGSMKLY